VLDTRFIAWQRTGFVLLGLFLGAGLAAVLSGSELLLQATTVIWIVGALFVLVRFTIMRGRLN